MRLCWPVRQVDCEVAIAFVRPCVTDGSGRLVLSERTNRHIETKVRLHDVERPERNQGLAGGNSATTALIGRAAGESLARLSD